MEEAMNDMQDIFQLDTAKEVREFIIKKVEPLIPDLVEEGFYLRTSVNNSIHY
jgi:predicted nucleic acid-binding protein